MALHDPARASQPQVIGRYALFDEIASGGMATVHLGRLAGSAGFSRTVAIKRLHPQYAKDPEFVSMFLDEARLASRIHHPNVVDTLDVVADDGEVFLVMEYVGGEALSKLLRNTIDCEEQVPAPVAVSIVCDLLNGLHAAHEAKSETGEPLRIVHRDVSPQNILVGLDGIARVLDFGVAKAALRAQSTREGQVKGKISYMSPEQLNAKEVDRRADIFAAGVVAWETLCGQRLFIGDDAGEIIGKLLSASIVAPNDQLARAGKEPIPPAVNDAVIKALARDPAQRFATAREFAIALEAAITVAPPHRVGEWVQEFAGPDLLDRTRKVAQVERHVFSFSGEFTPNPVSVGTLPVARSNDDATRKDVFAARTAPEPPVDFKVPRWRRALPVLAALTLLTFWIVMGSMGGEGPTQPSPALHPDRAANPPAMEEPSVLSSPGANPEVAVPATRSVVPSAGTAAPAAASASAAPVASGSPTRPGHVPPVSQPTLPKSPIKPATGRCNPPWRLDERGIKRLKPGCY